VSPFDDKDLSARFLTQERAVDRDTRNADVCTVSVESASNLAPHSIAENTTERAVRSTRP